MGLFSIYNLYNRKDADLDQGLVAMGIPSKMKPRPEPPFILFGTCSYYKFQILNEIEEHLFLTLYIF